MLQFTYISSAQRGIGASDVEAILASSWRNNMSNRISSLLVHRAVGSCRRSKAMRIWRSVATPASGSIRAIVPLSQREVAAREFGDWAMAYHAADLANDRTSLIETIDRLTAEFPDANTRELFRSFVWIERRAARQA